MTRDIDLAEPSRLAERLMSDGVKTIDFFNNLTDDHYRQVIYQDGTDWNAHLILSHLVSAEHANLFVVEDIIHGGYGAPVDFDIDRFNQEEVSRLSFRTKEALIHEFSDLRTRTVDFIRQISPDDLSRQGRHPFFGLARLEEIIKLIYRHSQIHVRDIRKVISS